MNRGTLQDCQHRYGVERKPEQQQSFMLAIILPDCRFLLVEHREAE